LFTIASASGNIFAFAWADDLPAAFDGSEWARILCARGTGLGLDGLFRLHAPEPGKPWIMDHWDADGAFSFCSNGSRAALALPGAPGSEFVEAISSGESIRLRRLASNPDASIGIRMPEGPGSGLKAMPIQLKEPAAFGFVGNPQLIIEVEDVESVDLATFAPPLRHHPAFPDGANVNILQPIGEGAARIRSWERGVEGETLCCGTGCAVAAAWLAQRTGRTSWQLQPKGGDPVEVTVALQADGSWRELWLSGRVRILATVAPDASLGLI
jgi:diaminopimelate epimerase